MGSSIGKMSGALASSRAIARRFLQAAGQRLDRGAPVREAGPAKRLRDAPGTLIILHPGQGGSDHVLDGAAGREDRILRDVADPDAAADRAGATVGGLDPGENPEKRGLVDRESLERSSRASMARSLLLSCEAVGKAYGARTLFDQLSFGLLDGDQVGLVGLNGSGKYCTGPARRMRLGLPGRVARYSQRAGPDSLRPGPRRGR